MKAYDEIPYRPRAFAKTRIGRLAAIGRLHGLDCPAPDEVRVLELGCAQGLNLMGQAARHPKARFWGLDTSKVEIDQGRELVRTLGLENVTLLHGDLRNFSDAGSFDYILAHGVFSWVSDETKDAIFALIQRLLSPTGLAYVSYNAYPGWYGRKALRELLALRTKGVVDATAERLDEARRTLERLEEGWANVAHSYSGYMRREVERLRRQSPEILLHDEMGEINDPCYFLQFVSWADQHGLTYLADADHPFLSNAGLTPAMAAVLGEFARNWLEREQYLDFLVGRAFRCSLIYRKDQAPLSGVRPDQLDGLFVNAPLSYEAGEADDSMDFRIGWGAEFKTRDKVVAVLLKTLSEAWPAALPWVDLCRQVAQATGEASPGSKSELRLRCQALEMADVGVVDFDAASTPCSRKLGEKPRAWWLARKLAASGWTVVNPYNMAFELDEAGRVILGLLDGTRDAGRLLQDAGDVISDQQTLAAELSHLASKGLLCGG